jgi:tetratricopeptide (TPR) repeat protein
MKIVEQTPTKLVLRKFPWFVACFAIFWLVPSISGMLFIGNNIILILFPVIVFFGVMFPFCEIVTCTFDKSLNSMILKRQTLLKTKLIERSIEAISGIKLEVRSGDDLDTYRVSIMLASGKCVPLTSVYTSGLQDKEKTAEDIATFLNVSNYGVEGSRIPQAEWPYWQKAIHLAPSEYLSRTPQEEIAHWQALIRLNPDDAEAYRNLGIALYVQDKKGNKKEALVSLRKSCKLFKAQGAYQEHTTSFYLYGWIFWGQI